MFEKSADDGESDAGERSARKRAVAVKGGCRVIVVASVLLALLVERPRQPVVVAVAIVSIAPADAAR